MFANICMCFLAGNTQIMNPSEVMYILCLIPRTSVTSFSAQGYALQVASFVRQSRCSFLKAGENTSGPQ